MAATTLRETLVVGAGPLATVIANTLLDEGHAITVWDRDHEVVAQRITTGNEQMYSVVNSAVRSQWPEETPLFDAVIHANFVASFGSYKNAQLVSDAIGSVLALVSAFPNAIHILVGSYTSETSVAGFMESVGSTLLLSQTKTRCLYMRVPMVAAIATSRKSRVGQDTFLRILSHVAGIETEPPLVPMDAGELPVVSARAVARLIHTYLCNERPVPKDVGARTVAIIGDPVDPAICAAEANKMNRLNYSLLPISEGSMDWLHLPTYRAAISPSSQSTLFRLPYGIDGFKKDVMMAMEARKMRQQVKQ